jgi:hypothetical protein
LIVADEVFLADQRLSGRIERGRRSANLLAALLDYVVEGRWLETQRDLGEILCLTPRGVPARHHRESGEPEGDYRDCDGDASRPDYLAAEKGGVLLHPY